MRYVFQVEKLNGRVVRVEQSTGTGYLNFAEYYLPAIQSDEQIRLKIYLDDTSEPIGTVLFKR